MASHPPVIYTPSNYRLPLPKEETDIGVGRVENLLEANKRIHRFVDGIPQDELPLWEHAIRDAILQRKERRTLLDRAAEGEAEAAKEQKMEDSQDAWFYCLIYAWWHEAKLHCDADGIAWLRDETEFWADEDMDCQSKFYYLENFDADDPDIQGDVFEADGVEEICSIGKPTLLEQRWNSFNQGRSGGWQNTYPPSKPWKYYTAMTRAIRLEETFPSRDSASLSLLQGLSDLLQTQGKHIAGEDGTLEREFSISSQLKALLVDEVKGHELQEQLSRIVLCKEQVSNSSRTAFTKAKKQSTSYTSNMKRARDVGQTSATNSQQSAAPKPQKRRMTCSGGGKKWRS